MMPLRQTSASAHHPAPSPLVTSLSPQPFSPLRLPGGTDCHISIFTTGEQTQPRAPPRSSIRAQLVLTDGSSLCVRCDAGPPPLTPHPHSRNPDARTPPTAPTAPRALRASAGSTRSWKAAHPRCALGRKSDDPPPTPPKKKPTQKPTLKTPPAPLFHDQPRRGSSPSSLCHHNESKPGAPRRSRSRPPGPARPRPLLRFARAPREGALRSVYAQLSFPVWSARRGAPCPQPGGTWKPWSLTPVFLAPIQLVTWSACASQEVLLQPSI